MEKIACTFCDSYIEPDKSVTVEMKIHSHDDVHVAEIELCTDCAKCILGILKNIGIDFYERT